MTEENLPENWGERDSLAQKLAAQIDVKVEGRMTPEESRRIRERQAGRARVMGVILAALCILFFAITIVKIGVWG